MITSRSFNWSAAITLPMMQVVIMMNRDQRQTNAIFARRFFFNCYSNSIDFVRNSQVASLYWLYSNHYFLNRRIGMLDGIIWLGYTYTARKTNHTKSDCWNVDCFQATRAFLCALFSFIFFSSRKIPTNHLSFVESKWKETLKFSAMRQLYQMRMLPSNPDILFQLQMCVCARIVGVEKKRNQAVKQITRNIRNRNDIQDKNVDDVTAPQETYIFVCI